MIALEVCAWLATYLVHSSLLLGGAWLVTRAIGLPRVRELIWKGALIGALVTASLQPVIGNGALSFGLDRLAVRAADEVAVDGGLADNPLRPDPEVEPGYLTSSGLSALLREPSRADESGTTFGLLETSGSVSPMWSRIVLGIWLLAAGLGLSSLWRQRARLRRSLAHKSPVAMGPMTEELRRQSRRLFMRVRLTSSPILTSPLALGSDEVCVPTYVVEELDSAGQSALLAHELEHLRRRDGVWLFFVSTLAKLLPMQPLIRFAGARLRQEAELLCDEGALARTGDGVALARCLATVAERFNGTALPTWTAAMASTDSELVRRVERVLGETPKKPSAWRLTALGLVGAVALGVLACAGPRVTSETAVPVAGNETAEVAVMTPAPQITASVGPAPEDAVTVMVVPVWSSEEIEGFGKTDPVREYPIYEVEGTTLMGGDPEELVSKLISELGVGVDRHLAIRATQGVIYKEIIPLVDAIIAAGFTHITFLGSHDLKRTALDSDLRPTINVLQTGNLAIDRPALAVNRGAPQAALKDPNLDDVKPKLLTPEKTRAPQISIAEDGAISVNREVVVPAGTSDLSTGIKRLTTFSQRIPHAPATSEMPMQLVLDQILVYAAENAPARAFLQVQAMCAFQSVAMPNLLLVIESDHRTARTLPIPVPSGVDIDVHEEQTPPPSHFALRIDRESWTPNAGPTLNPKSQQQELLTALAKLDTKRPGFLCAVTVTAKTTIGEMADAVSVLNEAGLQGRIGFIEPL